MSDKEIKELLKEISRDRRSQIYDELFDDLSEKELTAIFR